MLRRSRSPVIVALLSIAFFGSGVLMSVALAGGKLASLRNLALSAVGGTLGYVAYGGFVWATHVAERQKLGWARRAVWLTALVAIGLLPTIVFFAILGLAEPH
jgi:hypothetical protein